MTTGRKKTVVKPTKPPDGDALRIQQQLDAYQAAKQEVKQHVQHHKVEELQF